MGALELEDVSKVLSEAVPDEVVVLRDVVHHGTQAGQAGGNHCKYIDYLNMILSE